MQTISPALSIYSICLGKRSFLVGGIFIYQRDRHPYYSTVCLLCYITCGARQYLHIFFRPYPSNNCWDKSNSISTTNKYKASCKLFFKRRGLNSGCYVASVNLHVLAEELISTVKIIKIPIHEENFGSTHYTYLLFVHVTIVSLTSKRHKRVPR